MKAVVYNKKNPNDKLVYTDVENPSPKDSEVLVKVHAASVNAADYRSMKMGIIPKKKVFGADIAGTIESVGKDATLFSPGDEVFADLSGNGFGGFAEYAVVPEKQLAFKPWNLSFEEAAALPLASVTALQAIRDKGKISKGQQVLILGRFLSFGSKKMRTVAAKPNREDLGLIAKLAEEGRLKPVIEKIYPLEKTAEAMRYAGEGRAKGKVVVVVAGSQEVNSLR